MSCSPSASSSSPVSTTMGIPMSALCMPLSVSNPWLSGSDRSSNTRSIPPPRTQSMPLASRSTWVTVNRAWSPSASSTRKSRASPALSSTSRIWVETSLMGLPLAVQWKDHDTEPEVFYRPHHFDEPIQIDRFGHIAIGVEIIASEHILFIFRCRQHDDRNPLQRLVGFDLSQNLPAVL